MKSDICWVIILVISCIITFCCGVAAKCSYSLGQGYIECLVDIRNNRPMKYVLKKQANGETRWVKNTEFEK